MDCEKKKFIEFALKKGVLRFGNFTLKSKRQSPYFFDIGKFNTGSDLSILSNFYANTLIKNKVEFNILFGSAYKGIPLVISTVIALSNNYNMNISYSFNRKEIKNHGEGGIVVGKKLFGKVVVIDDVITSGLSIKESIKIIQQNNAKLAGVLVSFDRQETSNKTNKYHIHKIAKHYNIPVISIITFNDIICYLRNTPEMSHYVKKMINYQNLYN